MRRRYVRGALVVLGAAALMATVAAQDAPPPLVSSQELLDGLKADGSRWLTFGGNYTNQRHSPLTQITPANVTRLVPQWVFQTDTPGRFETTPLVRDNVLYVTGPLNVAWAIDARTGREDRRRRLGRDARRLLEGVRVHDRAARGQGQGDCRRRRRRVRHPRLHRRVRREDGKARVALLHDSRARRARPRHVGRRLVAARRRERVGDRRVRSGPQPGVLRHRESRSRLSQREPQGRQPVQRFAGRARSGY